MPEDNVEVVRRIWDLYSERTQEAVEATFDQDLVAADSEFFPAKEMPFASSYVGREAFMEFVRGWGREFAKWDLWPERFLGAPENRVVVFLRQRGLGRASGVEIETRFATVYTLDGGRVVERRDYTHIDEALEAAGLPRPAQK